MSLPDINTGNISSPFYERMAVQITKSDTSKALGVLRPYNWVYAIHVYVTEAFDGSSPRLTVGYTGTTNAYMTALDVSGTGLKTATLGSGVGYDATGRQVNVYRTGSGATTGKALIILEFFYAPKVN